jgi:three-Cys-motif partner protein
MNQLQEPSASWGGPWTEKKLDAFAKYVWSYLTIMKKFPYWETIYFDGFAGSGKRTKDNAELVSQLAILPEEELVYQGAAERVLKIDGLSFDYYYFIDQNATSLAKLKKRLTQMPESADKKMEFRPGDCNQYLNELAKALKSKKPSYAALVFLDPFGMQISWDSIAGLSKTRSDVWILIPTGVIVNRLLDRKGKLKSLKRLEDFFGLPEEEIKSYFYRIEQVPTLFGETEVVSKVLNPIEKISTLYSERLKTVWDHVTEKPLRLDNSMGVPIFHFVMASNNPNAVKIATQIIDKRK